MKKETRKSKEHQRSDVEFTETTDEAQALSGRLTTSQAASIAGVSPSTIVRNRALLGAIPGPNGAYLFDEREVRQKITTIRRRTAMATLGPTVGDVASAVFAALKAGQDPRDIVIEQRIPPDVVSELKSRYDEMQRAAMRVPRPKCRCGSDRVAVYCIECVLEVTLAGIERRTTADGTEEVRVCGRMHWGRLPGAKGRGRWSELVDFPVNSDWVAAESEDGQGILEARHCGRDGGARPNSGGEGNRESDDEIDPT